MLTKTNIRSYKDLNIWQLSMEIVVNIYKLTASFPKAELYGLTSQMRRASLAMPANISEGFERNHIKEYIQFLYIAKSSSCELQTLIEIASRIGYMQNVELETIMPRITDFRRMTGGLIKKLKMHL